MYRSARWVWYGPGLLRGIERLLQLEELSCIKPVNHDGQCWWESVTPLPHSLPEQEKVTNSLFLPLHSPCALWLSSDVQKCRRWCFLPSPGWSCFTSGCYSSHGSLPKEENLATWRLVCQSQWWEWPGKCLCKSLEKLLGQNLFV